MINDKQKKNREGLFRLMNENPELPVVPAVDWEIPGEDRGYWLGALGVARVDEYLIANNDGIVVFKNCDDVFDVLERCLSEEEFGKLPDTKEECIPYYDALPWKKAIIVYITLPEK